MTSSTMLFSLLCALILSVSVSGFNYGLIHPVRYSAVLFSEPRQPRRNLKKSRGRRQRDKEQTASDDAFPWESAESRPLVPATAIEAGEDYWIDEKDLAASQARDQAIKNRKALEGEISKEKLWEETLAPYKQNWIGLFSVGILILATIITKFPELLETPTPIIPDL